MSKEYKKHCGHVGPGGIRCSCCSPINSRNPKKIKKFLNRLFRHVSKQKIKKELE